MGYLTNEAKTLRWRFQVADKEILPPVPGAPPPPSGGGRLLTTTAVEFFDKRDKQFWPLYRQAVLWISIEDGRLFLERLTALIRDELTEFAFKSLIAPEIGWQFARAEDGRYVIQLGFDLNAMLAEVAGLPAEFGRDLALYRFTTTQPNLVAFGDQVRAEIADILGPATPAS
jgi:hypothetical protein